MEKPKNKSLKDFIVENIAQRMKMQEPVVSAIVSHQFKGITRALQKYKTVEMAGFGKWIFMEKRAVRFLDDMKEELENRRNGQAVSTYTFLSDEQLAATIEEVETHLKQNQTYNADRQIERDSRRLEEHGGEKPRSGRRRKSTPVDM